MSDRDAFLPVHGHLYECEGRQLQMLFNGMRVLELGTHYGRSAVAIAATAESVLTIDNYQGDSMIGAPQYHITLANLFNSGLGSKIYQIQDDWLEWLQRDNNSHNFEGVFYDAGHEPPGPYELEFLQWAIHYPEKLIAIHDYKPNEPAFAYLVQAVDAFAASTGRKRHGPECGSLVWFEPQESE